MLGHLGYLPPTHYNGVASIQITTNDQGHNGSGGPLSDVDTIGVTVTPVNNPPIVTLPSMPVVTPEDTARDISITVDDGDPEVVQHLTITLLSGPSHGTLSFPQVGVMMVDPGTMSITYTPAPNYNGPDSFTFRVTDDAQAGLPANLSTTATVTLSVSPVNDRPVAYSQNLTTTSQGIPLLITLNGDDGDPEVVQTLSYAIMDQPQHGTLSALTAGHQVTYTPTFGYTGPDQFTFIVIDDDKAGPIAYLASQPATISINTGLFVQAASSPAANVGAAPLTQVDLQPIVNEAIARWAAAGLSAQSMVAMSKAKFVVTDLPGAELGLASGGTIYVDSYAAGIGWFVDATPAKDEEFTATGSSSQLQAIDPAAVDRMDLLTVVEHELGHIVGLDDLASSPYDLMSSTLAKGVRRQVGVADIDAVFATYYRSNPS
jgi:predicted Zn-dependent protease